MSRTEKGGRCNGGASLSLEETCGRKHVVCCMFSADVRWVDYEVVLSENPKWIACVSLDLMNLLYLYVSNKGTIVASKEFIFTHQLTQYVFWRPYLVAMGVGLIDIHWLKLILNFQLQQLSCIKATLEFELFMFWKKQFGFFPLKPNEV